MSKIKEIHSRLEKSPEEYASIRFFVAKHVFVICVALYFLSYLFVVGQFYFGPFTIDFLSIIHYHLYSLLIISIIFFGYSLFEYWGSTYFRGSKIPAICIGGILTIFGGFALAVHLGIIFQAS